MNYDDVIRIGELLKQAKKECFYRMNDGIMEEADILRTWHNDGNPAGWLEEPYKTELVNLIKLFE